MELKTYIAYHELNLKISYWRTKTGLEVDFIMGQGEVADIVVLPRNIFLEHLWNEPSGFSVFCKEYYGGI